MTALVVGTSVLLSAYSQPANHDAEDAEFITQHGGDPKALDERFRTDIQIACSDGADDYLRSIAAHEFK